MPGRPDDVPGRPEEVPGLAAPTCDTSFAENWPDDACYVKTQSFDAALLLLLLLLLLLFLYEW